MNGSKTYEPAPSSVDQTAQSAVAPVKMQEQCGSSLSFSTTGGLENACSSLLADTTDSVCNGALSHCVSFCPEVRHFYRKQL